LGGLLYAFNKYIPYSCFLAFYLLSALFTLIYLKNSNPAKTQQRTTLSSVISSIKEMKPIIPFAAILFLAQFLMQPLFHYWQPLFEGKFTLDSKDMSIVFISYSLAMSSISWGYSRMTHFSILRSNLFIACAGIIGSLVYSLVARSNNFSFSLIFFALSFGVFNLVQIAGGVLIQNRLKQENRMVITKYVSFLSRIGMIISLVVLHSLFANEWEISGIYNLYSGLAMLSFCLYLGWIITKQTSEKKNAYAFEPSN
jgi:hypothetical protein